jgi:hypothetical protein
MKKFYDNGKHSSLFCHSSSDKGKEFYSNCKHSSLFCHNISSKEKEFYSNGKHSSFFVASLVVKKEIYDNCKHSSLFCHDIMTSATKEKSFIAMTNTLAHFVTTSAGKEIFLWQ